MDPESNPPKTVSDETNELRQRLTELEALEQEHRKLLESLRESEERYRELVVHAPAGICEVDYATGKFSTVNNLMCEFLGYSRDELLSMRLVDLLSADSQKVLGERMWRLTAGHDVPTTVEYEARKRNGEQIWVQIHVHDRWKDGMLTGSSLVIHDITERRKAEAQFSESEQRYRALFENSLDALYVHDLQGRFLDANDRALELLGYGRDEILSVNFAEILDEKEAEQALLNVRKIIETGQATLGEFMLRRRRGEEVWVEASGVTLSRNGECYAILGIARDISERKRAEQVRQRLEDQLRHAQKMEAIGTLAGGIAHDMNNMLSAIAGLASLLLDDCDPTQPQHESIRDILEVCRRGHDLTRSLLGFARKRPVRKERVSLNSVVRDSIDILSRTIPKGIDIEVRLEPSLLSLEGDAGQINNLLINIALNAAHAMQGKGTLRIATDNLEAIEKAPHVIAELGEQPIIKLEVQDTGPGMAPETLARAFEPFFTTKPTGKGTGLGLAMAYSTVHNHGGRIFIDSELGVGTTVTIYLPATTRVESKPPSSAPKHVKPRFENKTVLFVDDDPLVRRTGKRQLERLGLTVLVAEDGIEALDIYRDRGSEVDLVLLDLMMPRMAGAETFRELRKLNPQVAVLLSTGHAIEYEMQSLMRQGAAGLLEKPYEFEELVAALAKVFGG